MTAALTSVGIQYGSITIASGSTSNTATITAVGAGAFLLFLGYTSSNAATNANFNLVRITQTNSTTITAVRNTSTTDTITVNFCIVDGDTTNFVKSVQYGTINFGSSATGTATISAVTLANSAVHFLGYTNTVAGGESLITQECALSLTSTTQVTATLGSAPGTNTTTVSYVVIEFWSGALNSSVQAISNTASPGTTTRTQAITSVTLNNSILIWAGQYTSGGASHSQGFQYGRFTAANQITIGTQTAGSTSITYNCYVVEFAAAFVAVAAQRSLIAIAAAASNTAALSPTVTAARSLTTFGGNSTSGSVANTRKALIEFTSTSLMTARFGASATGSIAWELLELNAAASGTTYNDNYSESITLGESMAATLTANPAYSETLTLGNSLAATATFITTLSEAITLGDSMAGGLLLSGAVTESITMGDSVTAALTANAPISESITPGNTFAAAATFNPAFSEGVTLGDSNAAGNTMGATISESITPGDSVAVTQIMPVTIVEGVTMGDSHGCSAICNPSMSENLTLDVVLADQLIPPEPPVGGDTDLFRGFIANTGRLMRIAVLLSLSGIGGFYDF